MSKPRHLFVDGYNVLYDWKWLRAAAPGDVIAARGKLIEAVRAIHDVEGWLVTIVFDGRGDTATVDVGESEVNFQVIFAPSGKTADSVIEQLVSASGDPAGCTIATADHLERETVLAAGAACIQPAELAAWCERARQRARRSVAARSAKQNFSNRLPL